MSRLCPGCERHVLRPVEGGLGKMGQCLRCGWTGPLRREDEKKRRWSPVLHQPEGGDA